MSVFANHYMCCQLESAHLVYRRAEALSCRYMMVAVRYMSWSGPISWFA